MSWGDNHYFSIKVRSINEYLARVSGQGNSDLLSFCDKSLKFWTYLNLREKELSYFLRSIVLHTPE